jgi:hypothetical protein
MLSRYTETKFIASIWQNSYFLFSILVSFAGRGRTQQIRRKKSVHSGQATSETLYLMCRLNFYLTAHCLTFEQTSTLMTLTFL